ncbi:hypothetical protein CSW14_07040 [Thermus scotoductus]|uniref:PD-(D/E)XK endonuclease-like domain-containing protein n=1 Tax=Thermus scotoductus TaxID=37636 RepID=A0A430VPK6_THESC|nr:hypothetical protein [Thermus scotoductus]RTI54805.1 hypothetical protein CSW14_07040 [Thermus scotoductus]
MIVRHRKGYTLTFDPQTHRYTLENNGETRVLPSVTRVLSVLAKPRVNTWAMDTMAQHILDNYYPGMSTEEMILLLQEARTKPEGESQKAADTGSEVHDWIEGFLQGVPKGLPVNPRARKAVESFLDWWHREKRDFLLSEEIVAHPPLGYAGKVDLVLQDGTLVDFKTSKALYPEYRLQLGAYALALEWWENITPTRGLLVRLGKDGFLEVQEVDLERPKQAFSHLMEVYRYLNPPS